jgi:hypothetical protein
MRPSDLSLIQETLEAMREAELAVAELYEACAETWPQDPPCWKELSAEERRHAENLSKMSALLAARPDVFSPGRPFRAAAVRTFIKGVRWNRDRVKSGELDLARFYSVARDLENSLIESRIAEIVITDDPEYTALAQRVVADTRRHRLFMEARASHPKQPEP